MWFSGRNLLCRKYILERVQNNKGRKSLYETITYITKIGKSGVCAKGQIL